MAKGPFNAGDRVRITWAGDGSVLEGDLLPLEIESGDDLVITWGNQRVHFWDGAGAGMTYIFGLDDVTIEVLSTGNTGPYAPAVAGPAGYVERARKGGSA